MSRAAEGSLADGVARARAATDLARNLVVVAGAGTGKTSLLIERVLTGIGSGALEMDRLAAITFTEKAAGEMRQRLALGLDRLRALACAEGSEGKSQEARHVFEHLVRRGAAREEIAGLALRGLEHLETAKILTIHSFCSELLREHPVESRVAPDFRVDRGEHEREIFEEEWERFLAAELGPDAARTDLWSRVLVRSRLQDVREAARRMSGFGLSLEVLTESDERGVDALRLEARGLRERIEEILDRQQGMSPKPLAYFEGGKNALEAIERGGPQTLRSIADTNFALRNDKPGEPNKLLRNVSRSEFKGVASSVDRLLALAAKVDDGGCRDLVEALAPFAASFRERLLERGFVSFDGLLSLARDLLRDHPEVRESLKRRYRVLLVDEFQDTDPLQYEIVLYLAEREGASATDAYEAELSPGRLFVVGDPKQSIYRFRGADYSAFKRAIEKIAPESERLHLVSNFRSVPAVLGPVNALFGDPRVWSSSSYQPAYEAIRPTKADPGPQPRVEVWTVGAKKQKAGQRREAEGEAIATRIEELVRVEGYAYRDVFVLLRAFTGLGPYVRPMRARGIPFVVDGGREFLERTEVVQLLSALRTLAQPADAVALLAFLRSPAGAVPDTELARHAADPKRAWDWTATPDPGKYPGLARAFELLRRLARDTRGLPVDSVVRTVAAATHLLPLAAFGYEGAQRVANLRKLVASAAELSRDGSLSFLETLEAIETQAAAELEGDSPLADEATDAVRVATIHKAKGLENKVVFVPDLARDDYHKGFKPGAELEAIALPSGGSALALRVGDFSNAAWVVRDLENRRHEEAQDVRLLYVALTRAEERLIVVAGRSPQTPAWVRALEAWGYDAAAPPPDEASLCDGAVRHRAVGEPSPRAAVEVAVREDLVEAVDRYERAAARIRAEARPPLSTPSGAEEDETRQRGVHEADLTARGRPARDVARIAGIAVHRVLQHAAPTASGLLDALPAHARAAAAEARESAGEIEREARAILDGFVRSPLLGRLQGLEALEREIPMLYRDEEGVSWTGTIDLLCREADGTLVVVDYKTDADAEGAADRYRKQLEIYAAAVRRAMGSEARVRAEIWMLRRGEILGLEHPQEVSSPKAKSGARDKHSPAQRRLF